MTNSMNRPIRILSWVAAAVLFGRGDSAFADIDLYGLLNVTVQDTEEAQESMVELRSNASRIGVKGTEDLDYGLEAIYQLEWEVDPDGGDGSDNISPRNQFVGLEEPSAPSRSAATTRRSRMPRRTSSFSTTSKATSKPPSTARTA
jgi:hypothetical protein